LPKANLFKIIFQEVSGAEVKKEVDADIYFSVVEISGIEPLTPCGIAAHPPEADYK
jgi:hypothetical protein